MPVHFTCPHCAQLLSVARRKVGDVVRCVNCRGGVMVPAPVEGYTEEAEPPSEEYAALPGNESHGTLSAEILGSAETTEHRSDPRGTEAPLAVWSGTLPVTRFALYSIGALIVGTSLISFLLGWSMGQGSVANNFGVAAVSKHRIYGRVAYETASGRQAADTQSVVIALPRRKRPDEKLSVHSLRPENVSVPNSQDPSVLGIRAIGGDFALTNRTGDYELEVNEPGEYFVLILSSHAARPPNRPPMTNEIVELGQYFNQANVLLGKNDFVWTKHLVRTDKQFDKTFQSE